MASTEATHIDSTLTESRKFPPSAEFSAKAWVKSFDEYQALCKRADSDPDAFWAECARNLHWFKPFGKTLEWNFPFAKWFVGGTINASYNCLDRHLDGPRRNKAALIWEGEPGDSRVLTYQMLADEVGRCANGLKSLGVKDGDRVAIYMPLVPEAAIAMLACARIGAIHSVVFGGFSSEALADRINDAEAKVCITADGGWRRGQVVELKQNVDEALKKCPSIKKVLVLKRVGNKVEMRKGRDVWWDELVPAQSSKCEAAPFDSEHPLYTLYTSGTTGKPKGVVHTTGGYLTHVLMTMRWVFDLKDDDIYWCTADIGWVTGHSYAVYGPLAAGATVVMYEGAPNFPENDRFWQIIEKYKVSIFYTAPTAIRTFMKWGDSWVKKHDLSSLRLLGSVGEPINPAAWMWYRKAIGGERCPIVDTWWQTETGGIMISPMPGATAAKPGSATFAAAGNRGRRRHARRPQRRRQRGRPADRAQAVAGDAADDLPRPRALQEQLLFTNRRRLSYRRRRAARPGRLPVDHGPGGRRDQSVGPSAGHDGDRKRAGLACGRRRGGLRWASRRRKRGGRGRIRHARGRASR